MASGTQKVLTQVLKLVDAHDLVRRGRAGQLLAGGRGGVRRSAATMAVCKLAALGEERSMHRVFCGFWQPDEVCKVMVAPPPCSQPQYGSVAYPKHHTQQDISDIYLFAAVSPLRCV